MESISFLRFCFDLSRVKSQIISSLLQLPFSKAPPSPSTSKNSASNKKPLPKSKTPSKHEITSQLPFLSFLLFQFCLSLLFLSCFILSLLEPFLQLASSFSCFPIPIPYPLFCSLSQSFLFTALSHVSDL